MRSASHQPPTRMAAARSRHAPLLAAAAALAVLTALLTAPAATATPAPSSGYRFWGYYQVADEQWEFAQTGPDATVPQDGSTEGWRFAAAGLDDTRYPRATPTFDEVCGGTEAESGQKRVAVVVDYGRPGDAPEGAGDPPAPRAQCAVVPTAASGNDVVAAVADLRSEAGMTCSLDGWPRSGCGEPVEALPAEATAADEPVELGGAAAQGGAAADDAAGNQSAEDDGAGTGLWVTLGALALVVLIGVSALLRRRGASD